MKLMADDQDVGWMDRAACADADPELFFPRAVKDSLPAKHVCAICPVQPQCLQWALDNWQDYGVWGGLSEDERRALHGRWPGRRAPEGAYPSRADEIAANPGQLLRLLASDLTVNDVAIELGTNVATINKVQRMLAGQEEATAAGAVR